MNLIIFSHHGALWIAVGVGELGYDVDSVVKTLNTGKVIDFGKPLLKALIIYTGNTVQTAENGGGKNSII